MQENVSFPEDLLIGMANNMLSPVDWNVEFQAPTTVQDETRRLYAHRFVLAARSEYYKTSIPLVDYV